MPLDDPVLLVRLRQNVNQAVKVKLPGPMMGLAEEAFFHPLVRQGLGVMILGKEYQGKYCRCQKIKWYLDGRVEVVKGMVVKILDEGLLH